MMNSLDKAIDEFYQTCSDLPVPLTIEGCPCCVDANEMERLVRTPLREIEPDDISTFASKALLTVGTVSDYLYFLPRILELSIRDEWWWPDIEITARAICSTSIPSWTVSRRESLIKLLNAAIDDILQSSQFIRLDEWLCAIARMGFDVRPFLSKIESNTDAVLVYWRDNAECLAEEKLCNAFWEVPNAGYDEIVRWFKSEPVRRIIAGESERLDEQG